MTKYLLSVFLFLTTLGQAAAFAPFSKTSHQVVGTPSTSSTVTHTTRLAARPRRRNANNDEPLRREDEEIPQLPAFRGYRNNPACSSSSENNNNNQAPQTAPAFVNRKMELQYTCKVCETRNCHKVSRIAYNKGVVIAVCKGCMSQHLISDNLGFTQKFDGNIEDYFANSEESVTRVNEDVFYLEKVLGVDTKGGSLLGPDGESYLE